MIRSVKFNKMNNKEYVDTMWSCPSVDLDDGRPFFADSMSQFMICPSYLYLREGLYLETDGDIVKYFSDVFRLLFCAIGKH